MKRDLQAIEIKHKEMRRRARDERTEKLGLQSIVDDYQKKFERQKQ